MLHRDEESAIEEALSDEVLHRLAAFDAGVAIAFSAAEVIGEARTRLLAAMANDPAIQKELALIEQEFAVTDGDGLDGL
jgi:hypothetical protein